MKQDEIIEMARQAGMVYREFEDEFANANTDGVDLKTIKAFAKLVAAKEREDIWEMACDYTQRYNSHVCLALADAIRARGEA